jgi:hypothetical protein
MEQIQIRDGVEDEEREQGEAKARVINAGRDGVD